MDGSGLTQSSLLQISGHVLHRLMDLVSVPEDEPGGQDVLEGVAAQALVHLAVLAQVLGQTSTQLLNIEREDQPCE